MNVSSINDRPGEKEHAFEVGRTFGHENMGEVVEVGSGVE